ncbi:aldehyde dehydrogenase family protein [soil metagenome]
MMSIPTPAIPDFATKGPKQLFIDGKWVGAQSGETFTTLNPATGKPLAEIAKGGAADVDLAVIAARRAFEGEWSRVKPYDRQQILLRLADLVDANFEELAILDTLEMGAPISRTRLNKRRAMTMLRYYAGMATQIGGETVENSMPGRFVSYIVREPVGVVGAIVPWNGPLTTAVWKIAPAIATGCTIVFKPAEEASLTPLRFAELATEAGLPAGVLNVITGFGEVGAAIAGHMDIDKVAFTGSTQTGQHIIRASAGNIKRLSLELGGKSPDIVMNDANLDAAVPGASMAVFANAGQICSAGTRLFVQRGVYDEFVERVGNFANALKVGNGMDPEVQMGPLVSSQQLDRVSEYLSAGREEGAQVVAGGERLTEGSLADGYFVKPTVFGQVGDTMSIAREEIFGPVISAIPFDDLDEVVRRANATEYGLGSGVWTTNLSTAHELSRSIRAGSVWVNCYQAMDPGMPFGGYKMSGYGRESGREHLDEFLHSKSVWINLD